MNGYRRATEAYPVVGDESLLTLFLIEKAAYEVTYEAANRPTWIDVPVRGLARLAAQAAAEGATQGPPAAPAEGAVGGRVDGPVDGNVESKVT